MIFQLFRSLSNNYSIKNNKKGLYYRLQTRNPEPSCLESSFITISPIIQVKQKGDRPLGNSIGALLGSQNCKRSRLNVTYLVPEKYSQTLISIVSEYFGKLTVIKTYIFASLAQLVERVICNLEVVGSIPTGGSKGLVVQLIRTSVLHTEGPPFDPGQVHTCQGRAMQASILC